MPTLVPYLDSPNPTAIKPDAADYEPDEQWKHQLKKRIEESLESMVKDVKENQAAQLRKEVVTPETRMRLEEEYKQAMANIKALANDQYLLELDHERNQRRWLKGAPVSAEWGRILAEEQQSIMNTIKNNQDDKTSAASPTDERNPPQPTKPEVVSTKTPRSASLRVSSAPHPVLDPKEEGDKNSSTPTDPPRSARRGSDAKATLTRDQEGRSRSRRHHSTSHSRGSLPDDWEPPVEKASKDSDHPEEPHRPSPRSRPPAEHAPSSPEVIRRDALQGRRNSLRSAGSLTARSPPKLVPEVWKPAATPEDDSSVPKSYDLGRRGSSTSMKSTASGTGVRPIISATIPERIDAEGPSPAESPNHEQDKTRKHRDKERRGGRKNSRPTPVELPDYPDDIQLSSLRSAGTTSLVMQMATSSTPVKALSSKPSFASAEDRYHRDQHPFPRDAPPPREPSYPSRDIPPNARSGHVRPPYGVDERDYGAPYQTSQRPSKTPFRDYPQVPHQLYEERRRDRDREEWDHDLDDDYGREYERRDWDRDPYPESRHHGHYPHSTRSATYPTPTTSAARHSVQDYGYDDREAPARGYGYRGPLPTSSPPDEWDYSRSDSTRPTPTRQPSYRRDDPERDPYSLRTYSSAGIPIASRHAPSNEDLGGPAWKEWGHARSPAVEQISRRRHRYYNGDLSRDDASFPAVHRKKRPPRLAGGRDYDHDQKKEGDASSDDEEIDDGHSEMDESEEDMFAQAKELEEERKLANERIQEKAAEIRRLQEVEKRLEEEARRKEEGLRLKEETFKKQEDEEERRAEEEARQKVEEETKRKEEELRKKNREAQRKEQEAKRKEEAKKKEEEVKEEAEKAKQLQQKAAKQAAAARLKQEALRQKEEETRRKEQEIEAREHALRVREEELKIREEEAQRREEEAWRKDEEARKKEAEVKKKEQEARRREEEVKRKEEDAKKKEEEAQRKEEEVKKREQEAAAKVLEEKARQDARRKQDPERFFDDLDDVDSKFIEEQTRLLQQAQYRKREEEIKRNREERKRQDSVGNDSAWAAPGSSPGVAKPFPQFTPAPQYSAPSPSPSSAAWTTWGSPPPKVPGSATLPNGRSASSSTVPPPLNKPRNGSVSSGSHPTSTSPHSATPITESEWARRHAEFTNNQQAKFRREQEKLEAERQLRAAGKPLTRDEVSRLMEHHDRLWTRLPTIHDLTWTDFPWPVLRTTMNADDITLILVSNYFQSPLLPDKDKSRSPKERIKEHLRRWHPDRFESKVLPRVLESEKEKVKQGAGNVVRCLNDLLRKENESGNAPSPFGE